MADGKANGRFFSSGVPLWLSFLDSVLLQTQERSDPSCKQVCLVAIVIYQGRECQADVCLSRSNMARTHHNFRFIKGHFPTGRDFSTFTSGAAAQFISDYSTRFAGQNPSLSGAYAYDAAMVLITAIKHLIATKQAVTRADLIDQVQRIQYAGVTGPISFDTNGDIAHGVFCIYTVQDGKWAYAWQLSV